MLALVHRVPGQPQQRTHLWLRPWIDADTGKVGLAQCVDGISERVGGRRQVGEDGARVLLVVCVPDGSLVAFHRDEDRSLLAQRQGEALPLDPEYVADVAGVLQR